MAAPRDSDPLTSERARALAARIPKVAGFCPQQIVAGAELGRDPTDAVLIDQWGRLHALSPLTVLGREPGDDGIALLESSVSRLHAELRLDPAEGQWWLSDLASTNGTFVDGHRVDAPRALTSNQVLVFGDIGLAFVTDQRQLSVHTVTESILATQKLDAEHSAEALRLIGASSGAGGLVEYGGDSVQLGSTQFALMMALASRVLAEQDQPAEVRGFVRSVELITELPWDTPSPSDNNVKQLVRRVRRALERLGLPDAIEARQRFGYRLTMLPVVVAG